jgi:hypothetical protein
MPEEVKIWSIQPDNILGRDREKLLVEQAAPVKVSFECAIQSHHLSQVQLADQ